MLLRMSTRDSVPLNPTLEWGEGESGKNLIFITQTNESVTFSQRVLSKIVKYENEKKSQQIHCPK